MCNRPDWLPPIREMNGDWATDQAELYAIFVEAFINNKCYFQEQLVWPDKTKYEDDIEEGFWHVITANYTDDRRLVDPRRAERLVWIRPLIENHDDASVRTFTWLHNGKKPRIYIWKEDCDYLVILEPTRNGKMVRLITAFYLDGKNSREKYTKRYNERVQ